MANKLTQLLSSPYLDRYKSIDGLKKAIISNLDQIIPNEADYMDKNKILEIALNTALAAPTTNIKNITGGYLFGSKKTLYHGGDEKIFKFDNREPYRSLFSSPNKSVARSHGDNITTFNIPENKIINGWLDAEQGYEKTKNVLDEALIQHPLSLNYLKPNDIYDIVVYGDESILKNNDLSMDTDLMIELQALRADVAKKLGYHAVDSLDEHGTSYQIVKALTKNNLTSRLKPKIKSQLLNETH